MIVVFDTDVLIPMILPASLSARLYFRLRAAGHKVATSALIIEEVTEKLLTDQGVRRWLKLSDAEISSFLNDLPRYCVQIRGLLGIAGVVVADRDDDKIIAAAVESGAEYIVSEDHHLRDIGEWAGIKIVNRKEFMIELDRLGVT
jgi:putative PIN family toxin of toxin-antitoxin system